MLFFAHNMDLVAYQLTVRELHESISAANHGQKDYQQLFKCAYKSGSIILRYVKNVNCSFKHSQVTKGI